MSNLEEKLEKKEEVRPFFGLQVYLLIYSDCVGPPLYSPFSGHAHLISVPFFLKS